MGTASGTWQQAPCCIMSAYGKPDVKCDLKHGCVTLGIISTVT
jgi:hypothetical protein